MTAATLSAPDVAGLPPSPAKAQQLWRVKSIMEKFGVGLSGNEERDLITKEVDPWFGGGPEGPSEQDILALALACRGSLTLAFDDIEMNLLEHNTSVQDIRNVLVKARTSGVKLFLALDKSALLKAWEIECSHCTFTLFLYKTALISALARPIAFLESGRGLFEHATGERKTMILVVDCDILLDGPYLGVLGGSLIADWQRHCPDQPPDPGPVRELHRQVLDTTRAVSWIGFYLNHLTPIQLAAETLEFCAHDPVVQAFQRKRIELVAVYTANQTREIVEGLLRRSKLLCRYQGESSSGDLLLVQGGAATDYLPQAASILGELVKWVYTSESRDTDRLTVLRNVFANQLGGADAESNYHFLINEAGRLDNCVRNSWKTFVEEKLSAYFDRMRQMEELIDRTAESFRDHLQTLIKSMSENMLAGVGVVIASLVAAMFGSDFNTGVFRFGLVLYALYLLIFPGLIGISSIRTQAKEAEGTYKLQVDCFSRSAPKELVEDVLSRRAATVEEARNRFYRWFNITARVYAAAILALLLIGWLVPGRL